MIKKNSRCEKKPRCRIPVDSSIFGDPCPGTNKYVEVHYTCQPELFDSTPPAISKALPPWLLDLAATPSSGLEVDLETLSSNLSTEANLITTQNSVSTTKIVDDSIAPQPDDSDTREKSYSEGLMAPNQAMQKYCHPNTVRSLFWNWTQSGEDAIQVCPQGSAGFARWTCGTDGVWLSTLPNLGECHSQWLSRMEVKVTMGETSISDIVSEMLSSTHMKTLYGSDLTSVAKIMQSISHRVRQDLFSIALQRNREKLTTESYKASLKITSNVFDSVQRLAWNDLESAKRVLAFNSLLIALEENALILAETLNDEKIVVESSSQVLASVIVMRSRGVNDYVFPINDDPHGQVIVPYNTLMRNSINGAVRLAFFSFGNIVADLFNNNINSKIVGAVTSRGRYFDVAETPVKVILKHLEVESGLTNSVCVMWNYSQKIWSEMECSTIDKNSTHSSCSCRRLGHYAILIRKISSRDSNSNPYPELSLKEQQSEYLTRTIIIVAVICILTIFMILIVFVAFKNKNVSTQIDKFISTKSLFCFHCKKDESVVNTNSLYPALTSSPTSTTVSADTPDSSACSSNYLVQFLEHQAETMKQRRTSNRGSVYQVTAPRVQCNQERPPSPYRHHIYMEIDPVYARVNAESESHSDFQMSDMSDDDLRRLSGNSQASFNRYYEERPLIRSNQFVQSLSRLDINKYSFTNHKRSQNQQKIMLSQQSPYVVPLPLSATYALRNPHLHPMQQQHRYQPQQQQPYQQTSTARALDTPITIALQGGDQFVRLKINGENPEAMTSDMFVRQPPFHVRPYQ